MKMISQITGKEDASIREDLLQVYAAADLLLANHSQGLMHESAVQYMQPVERHCSDPSLLTAVLEQNICTFLNHSPAITEKLQLNQNSIKTLLVIALYAEESQFVIADCSKVAGQVVATVRQLIQSDKAGSFAESIVARRLRDDFATSMQPHLASSLQAELFLPAARRLFKLAAHGAMPEGTIEELIVHDGMPIEFHIHLTKKFTSTLLSPLLGPDGKLSGKLKKIFAESSIDHSNLSAIICTGSYASNIWLQQKLISDFKLPLFLLKTGAYLHNLSKEQPKENNCEFTAFTIKSDPDLTPVKAKQMREQRELEHVLQIVQKEIQAQREKQRKEEQLYLLYTDPQTGLQWVRNGNLANRKMNWHDAQEWVEQLDYAGYQDWRLPTKEELEKFAKMGGKHPSEWFNANGFNNIQAYSYWSSSTYAYSTFFALNVYMVYGYVNVNPKTYDSYVWPVRAGQ